MCIQPPIILSSRDVPRLEQLLDSVVRDGVAQALEAELLRGDVREADTLPADVVTMNSQVRCVEEHSHHEYVLRLVFPRDAGRAEGNVSVLAPVGAALLGLSAGQSIDWALPDGRVSRIRVAEVMYQPEAAGEPG